MAGVAREKSSIGGEMLFLSQYNSVFFSSLFLPDISFGLIWVESDFTLLLLSMVDCGWASP